MKDILERTANVLRQYINTPESRELLEDIQSILSCGRPKYRATAEFLEEEVFLAEQVIERLRGGDVLEADIEWT